MPDIWTEKKRSEVMSLIRGKGNKQTEQALLSLLKRNKITGWRRHLPLPGKPDFAFLCLSQGEGRRLRRRMFLARLPQVLHPPENQPKVLGP